MNGKLHPILANLPLFQGVAANDLAHVLEKVAFEQLTLDEGEMWVQQGDVCQHLVFLTEGTLMAETERKEHNYTFAEEISAPNVIEPDILYGIQRRYGSKYTAATRCRLLLIPKNDVGRLLFGIEVFRLNYLNLISTMAWRRKEALLPATSPTLRDAVVHFLGRHASTPQGRKIFYIRMSDIALYLGVSRVLISKILHQLQDEDLLHIDRSFIEIPHLELLYA